MPSWPQRFCSALLEWSPLFSSSKSDREAGAVVAQMLPDGAVEGDRALNLRFGDAGGIPLQPVQPPNTFCGFSSAFPSDGHPWPLTKAVMRRK